MAAPPRRSPPAARTIAWPTIGDLWVFLGWFLPALAALLVPMPAVDLAYQLRAGADILAGNGIPTVDTWTFTAAGTPWLDQQWGAQVVLAAVFQAAGWTGLALLRAALVGAVFALTLAAIRSAWSIASARAGGSTIASSARTATLIVLAFFTVAAPALALRPQLVALVLFAATLLILVERAAHPRRLWLIPLMAAAWANLHGSFPLVIVLVGLAWLDEVGLLREPIPAGQPRRRLPARLLGSTGIAIIGGASALATLVNPFGVDVWRYVADLASNPAVSSAVSEWRAPSPLDPSGAVFYLSLVAVLGVLAFRFRSDGGRPPARFLAPIVTVLVFGVLGVVTGRGLAWWALAAPVAMVQLQPGLRLADASRPRPAPNPRPHRARGVREREPPLAPERVAHGRAAPRRRGTAAALAPRRSRRRARRRAVATPRRGSRPSCATGRLTARSSTARTSGTRRRWGSWLEFAAPDLRTPSTRGSSSSRRSSGRRPDRSGSERRVALDPRQPRTSTCSSPNGTRPRRTTAWSRRRAWALCAAFDGDGSVWLRATGDLPVVPGCLGA